MRDTDSPLLEVTDLRVEFRSGREIVRAVNGATFSVRRGETVARSIRCSAWVAGRGAIQKALE